MSNTVKQTHMYLILRIETFNDIFLSGNIRNTIFVTMSATPLGNSRRKIVYLLNPPYPPILS